MKTKYSLILCIILSSVFVTQLPKLLLKHQSPVSNFNPKTTIVIDAGHGGEDGGAVSAQGHVESHMNLAIALKLEQLLLFYGIEPVLLRDQDISLHDPDLDTVKERKTSDLKNRVSIINEIENAFLISIHQNFFTETQYTGAQVFYTEDSPETEAFALFLQTLLRENLDPSNKRTSKIVDPSLYLFQHIEGSGILLECGFLSNPEEALLLADPVYQQNIACVLVASLLQKNTTLI